MSTFSIAKDPQSVVDYIVNWTNALNGDTISTSVWTADGGLVVDSDSETTTHATVWVSAGTLGKYCNLVNTITTAGGRTMERTVIVEIRNL